MTVPVRAPDTHRNAVRGPAGQRHPPTLLRCMLAAMLAALRCSWIARRCSSRHAVLSFSSMMRSSSSWRWYAYMCARAGQNSAAAVNIGRLEALQGICKLRSPST